MPAEIVQLRPTDYEKLYGQTIRMYEQERRRSARWKHLAIGWFVAFVMMSILWELA